MCPARSLANNMTATSLSKRTEPDTLARFKDAPDSGRKELIVRTLGEEDRRLMQFHLSQSGKKLVRQLALEKSGNTGITETAIRIGRFLNQAARYM